jgi:hypothetical protein
MTDPRAHEAERISREIRPLLAGRDPGVQSAILADLLSIWVVGHHPLIREQALRDHVALVEQLVPASEQEIFGKTGHPGRADLI